MDGQTNKTKDGWINRQKNGWMNDDVGWMDGWMKKENLEWEPKL